MKSKVNFQFYNHITPRHVTSLFLRIEYGTWYSLAELRDILRSSLDVEGTDIVAHNVETWEEIGLGETRFDKEQGRQTFFRLTGLGRQMQETYGTNQELFFELMHYLFYAPWERKRTAKLGRYWLYSRVCRILWDNAPNEMNSNDLTGVLQEESQYVFPGYVPKFPERSISAVFPWLQSLRPPFLERLSKRPSLTSRRRSFCSPQLFHLAVDLIYGKRELKYGTSMSIGDEEIASIASVCLLDPAQFWEMADRMKMIVRGVDIRRGQFGTSLALEGRPQWIDLPEYPDEAEYLSESEGI